MSSELSDKAKALLDAAAYRADPPVHHVSDDDVSDDEKNSDRWTASSSSVEPAQGQGRKPGGDKAYERAKAVIEGYLNPSPSVARIIGAADDVTALTNWAEASEPNRNAFARWIKLDASFVAKQRRAPGFASIIEAAFRLNLPGLENCVEAILMSEQSDPEAAAVAGQRVRFLRIVDAEQRGRIGKALQVWIEHWESGRSEANADESLDIDRAVTALPSVPSLLHEKCIPWMAERIQRGVSRIAWAAAVGLHRWFSSAIAERCDQASRDQLCKVVLERIAKEDREPPSPTAREDLRAELVALLGFLASPSTLEPVSQVLSAAFQSPRRFEDTAAVEAGRMLLKRLENEPFPYWHKAFGGADSKAFFDFNRALAKPRTARV